MAFVTPTDVTVGSVLTASKYNQEVVENTDVIRAAQVNVASTLKEDTFNTTSTSFVDVTGLSVTITPSSSTSKVLVVAVIYTSASTTNLNLFNLLRGSTNIAQPTTSPGSFPSTASVSIVSTSENNYVVPIYFLDSPATTSATTYKIQMRTSNGAVTARVNLRGDSAARSVSTITAMEVPV
jgi:hypothetical protein